MAIRIDKTHSYRSFFHFRATTLAQGSAIISPLFCQRILGQEHFGHGLMQATSPPDPAIRTVVLHTETLATLDAMG